MTVPPDETEFDAGYWHDCAIHSVRFVVGDPERDEWVSDLMLDIDFIVEWVCGTPLQFRVAPATLTFHDVTDLHVSFPNRSSTGNVTIALPCINSVERAHVQDQKAFLDRNYYRWRMTVYSLGEEGEISFGASGFEQHLRADPVLIDNQSLSSIGRAAMP